MKRGTPDHPKTLLLTMELEKVYAAHRKKSSFGGKSEAVGILEVLWDWASKYAIQGDIGKWPDDIIAKSIGWTYSGKELISCLIASGWVDVAAEPFRLVIHDIQDHATNCWRQNLENAGLTWWDGSPPRKYKLQKSPKKVQEKSNHPPQPEPEPEPEAEPETHTARATVPDKPPPETRIPRQQAAGRYGWQLDEPFCEFGREYAELAAPGGLSLNESDFSEAYPAWNASSMDQQLAIVASMRDRAGRVAPRFWVKPAAFIRGEYRRAVKGRAGPQTTAERNAELRNEKFARLVAARASNG